MDENANAPVDELSGSQKGVSNTTIAVLIILALLITIIGTWAVLTGTNSASEISQKGSGTNVGRVSFSVIPYKVPSNVDTGMVTLEIIKR